jgi:hypothetical protein
VALMGSSISEEQVAHGVGARIGIAVVSVMR